MRFDPDAPAQEGSGIFGLPHDEASAGVVLIPVPFEATTSYGGGTAEGPRAILEASRQVDLYDHETGRPYQLGIYMRPIATEIESLSASSKAEAQKIIEAGGVIEERSELVAALARVNRASQQMNRWVEDSARALLRAQKIVGTIGGDHSVPLGAIRAHAEALGEFGILHLDAHADLRVAYEGFTYSHASIMERVLAEVPQVTRLVQVAIRDLGEAEAQLIAAQKDRVVTVFDAALARARVRGRLLELFDEAVARLPHQVYLSFDIDGLDPRFCPGTGTPVPGGLDFNEVSMLMESVVRAGKKIIGFDLCEVAPRPNDEWDGNVGARLLYKMIGWTLASQPERLG